LGEEGIKLSAYFLELSRRQGADALALWCERARFEIDSVDVTRRRETRR
jgi:hypothetical protein